MKRQKKRLRIGVVGGGAIAQAGHLPYYVKDRGCEIYVATRSRERRAEIEATFKSRIAGFYSEWRKLLKEQSLDAVSICTPNNLHAKNCIEAAQHGAHILCEKPMALRVAEARRMIDVCKKKRRILMVNFTTRFWKGAQRVKQLMDSGRIGDVQSLRIRLVHDGPYTDWAKGDWFYDPKRAGGGALMDMGVHAIDACHYLLGPIRSVTSTLANLTKDIDVEDSAAMTATLDGGRYAILEAGWTGGAGFTGIEVSGSRGSVILDYRKGLFLILGKSKPDGSVEIKEKPLRCNIMDGGWGAVIKEFLTHVRNGSRPECNGEVGLKAIQVALAARRSHASGKWVSIP